MRDRLRSLAILTVVLALGASISAGRLAAQGETAVPVIRPGYGDGIIWNRLIPQLRDRQMRLQTSGEVLDSTMRAMSEDYQRQRRAAEELAASTADWSTEIAGQRVGINSAWIELGPLRIPTALLALLPLNFQGNPTEAARSARLQFMREDLLNAARRNAGLDGLMEAGRELRAEVEARREFERNRRNPPPRSGEP